MGTGGIAVALSDEDEIGLHEQDTIKAGDGLCRPDAVALLVEEGPKYITELIEWGTEFDRAGTKLAFTREAAIAARASCTLMEFHWPRNQPRSSGSRTLDSSPTSARTRLHHRTYRRIRYSRRPEVH